MVDGYPKAGVCGPCCRVGGLWGVHAPYHPAAAGGVQVLCSGSAPRAPTRPMDVACFSGTSSQPHPILVARAALRSIGVSMLYQPFVIAPNSQLHFLPLKMPMSFVCTCYRPAQLVDRGYCIRGSLYQPKDCGLEWHRIPCQACREERPPCSTGYCLPI